MSLLKGVALKQTTCLNKIEFLPKRELFFQISLIKLFSTKKYKYVFIGLWNNLLKQHSKDVKIRLAVEDKW